MKNNFASETNKRLCEARKSAGLTQQKLAALIGMKRNTYARMEKCGNPDIKTLKKLTEVLGISADWLLNGDTKAEEELPDPEFSEAVNLQKSPSVLNTPTLPYDGYLPFVPSPAELNCLKVLHVLKKKESRELALEYLNELYRKEQEK